MNTWEDLLGRIGQSPLPLLALFATTHTRQTTQCRGMRSKFSPLHLTTWSCACVNRSSPFVTNPLSSTTKNPRIYCVSRLVSSDLCYCIFMVYFSLDYCLHFLMFKFSIICLLCIREPSVSFTCMVCLFLFRLPDDGVR